MVALTKGNVQDFLGNGRPSSVILYHMQGCPHCVMMWPNWESAVKSAGKGVQVVEIEYGQMGILPKALQNVRGFPTIMAVRDGRPYAEYSGDRSAQSLREFIRAHASAAPPAAPAAKKKAAPTPAKKRPAAAKKI